MTAIVQKGTKSTPGTSSARNASRNSQCPPSRFTSAAATARKRLEEVSPKCAFVCFAHPVKSRAELTDALGYPRRKHFGRQCLLDDLVPLRIPGRPAELDLLLINRGWRSWFGGLRVQSCGYSCEEYETHDERCLQRRNTHVYQRQPPIDKLHCRQPRPACEDNLEAHAHSDIPQSSAGTRKTTTSTIPRLRGSVSFPANGRCRSYAYVGF
jgi:hypothetical protein